MPELRPTPAFADATLELATVRRDRRSGRIFLNRFPDPLGFGKNPSRFSDPRRRIPGEPLRRHLSRRLGERLLRRARVSVCGL
jgi:hypothetical protein